MDQHHFVLKVSLKSSTQKEGMSGTKHFYWVPLYGMWSFHASSGADPGFGQGGPQLLRPKVANVVKRNRASEASILRPGSRALLGPWKLLGF